MSYPMHHRIARVMHREKRGLAFVGKQIFGRYDAVYQILKRLATGGSVRQATSAKIGDWLDEYEDKHRLALRPTAEEMGPCLDLIKAQYRAYETQTKEG